ncbi:MAG: M20/M25/M40 family metallo-hydrolase, partial [Phycisphaerae bacterium]
MTVEPALSVFERQRKALLDDLMTFLRFETISAQPAHAGDCRKCAEWVRNQLAGAGLRAEIINTKGHPAVFADSGAVEGVARPTTLLFYGHYDVQPVGDPKLWHSPAFEPTLREGALYARGSADDKGQVFTHLAAMRCLQAAGLKLPLRLKFII